MDHCFRALHCHYAIGKPFSSTRRWVHFISLKKFLNRTIPIYLYTRLKKKWVENKNRKLEHFFEKHTSERKLKRRCFLKSCQIVIQILSLNPNNIFYVRKSPFSRIEKGEFHLNTNWAARESHFVKSLWYYFVE